MLKFSPAFMYALKVLYPRTIKLIRVSDFLFSYQAPITVFVINVSPDPLFNAQIYRDLNLVQELQIIGPDPQSHRTYTTNAHPNHI